MGFHVRLGGDRGLHRNFASSRMYELFRVQGIRLIRRPAAFDVG